MLEVQENREPVHVTGLRAPMSLEDQIRLWVNHELRKRDQASQTEMGIDEDDDEADFSDDDQELLSGYEEDLPYLLGYEPWEPTEVSDKRELDALMDQAPSLPEDLPSEEERDSSDGSVRMPPPGQ